MVNCSGKHFGKWSAHEIDFDTIGDLPVILWQKIILRHGFSQVTHLLLTLFKLP